MTQEFHLSVTPVGTDTYLVRTELVAPGVPLAEEQVTWQVDEWLNQARQLLNDPLLGLLQDRPDSQQLSGILGAWIKSQSSEMPLNLVSLGQRLYEALFWGTIRDSWMMAQSVAVNRGEELRLRLGLKERRLARLPWEVLYDGSRPLAAGTDVVFSRYQPTRNAGTTHALGGQPLRILMAIAAPTDQETLELEREANHLQTELQQLSLGMPEIQLTILSQPDREQLTQALEHRQYHVFHYAGHSDLGVAGGEIYLVSGRTGLTERLSGDDLAGLLVNNGIRMAVFNSCRGADGATADLMEDTGERNLAETLVKRGVPGVLAMAERIPDQVALTLSQLFYRNIKQGYPIDLSLSRARAGLISAYGSHQLYWALPILYLQPEFDGHLTQLARRESNYGTPATERLALAGVWEEGFPDLLDQAETPDRGVATDSLDTVETYQRAIALNPNDVQAYYQLGVALAAQGRTPEAIAAYELALSVNPYFADAYAQLGVALASQKRTPEAIAAYRRALDLNPEHEVANHYLNLALQSQPVSLRSHHAVTPSQPKSWLHRLSVTWRWWLLVGMGFSTIGLLGVGLLLFKFPSQQAEWQVQPTPLETAEPLATAGNVTERITAKAIEAFRQGNLEAGSQGVEQLLDQGVLNFANTALESVSSDQRDRPEVSFLRGRLQWEALKQGDPKYSIDDVRRSWQTTVDRQDHHPTYQNALGFAYYVEGNTYLAKGDRHLAQQAWKRADRSWRRSLELLNLTPQLESSNLETPPNPEALTAYAGLALVRWKSAQILTPEQQESLTQQALTLYRYVLHSDPVNFQPETLATRNWLWTAETIRDWQAISPVDATTANRLTNP